jgi:DNA processing protein
MQTVTPSQILGGLSVAEAKWAPSALYVAGDLSLAARGRCLSIIGSRKASPEGLRRAAALAHQSAIRGFSVLSGLAKGVDTAAHRAAIAAGGRTVAVIGTPLDVAYPAENRALQEEIAERHLLISQFSIGSQVHRSNFPVRNRTMALLSAATVIIEAEDGSGTIHQAWEALRLGRELYLPESVVSRKDLKWPSKLLDYGARVLSGSGSSVGAELFEYLEVAGLADEDLLAAAL